MRKVFLLWVLLLLPLGLWAEASSPASVTGATSPEQKVVKAETGKSTQSQEKKIQELEKKIDELSTELKVLKGKSDHLVLGNLKLWGYLRMRYTDDLKGKYSALSIEEMTLNLVYHPASYITAWMNFWVHPNQIVLGKVYDPTSSTNEGVYPAEGIGYLYIERAQVEFKLPSLGLYTHSLRAGKWYRAAFGIPPSYPNRKISDYSLVSEAFTHDRALGIDYISSFDGMINFALSVYNGMSIGSRNFGPSGLVRPVKVAILADREILTPCGSLMCTTDNDYNKAVSFKLGYQWPSRAIYKVEYARNGKYFQVDVFGTIGNKLNDADYGTLTGKFNIPTNIIRNRKKYRAGADARLVFGKFSSDFEIFKGWTGGLQTVGFQILGVYKVLPGKFDVLARYAELDNVNITKDESNMGSAHILWDKRQIQLSMKFYLAKWAWVQTDYYFNWEGPKGDVTWTKSDDPDTYNDVFFIELVFFYM